MITAIIVNYYCHALTCRAVKSILEDQPQAQVIVVDNSVDEDECRALQEMLPHSVKTVINEENSGFGRACNLVFSHAENEWVLLLNPDAYVLNGCIDALVNFLLQTPQAGAVAPLVYWDHAESWMLPPAQLPIPSTELGMTCALRLRFLGGFFSHKFRRRSLHYNLSKNAVKQKMLSGGHMLLRKSAIVACGGLFDPDFFMYYEDTDLSQRLQKSGYDLYLLPAAHAVHEWTAEQKKNKLSETSRQLYFSKHFPHSRLMALREKIVQLWPGIALPESVDLGICSESPNFAVPAAIQNNWVMELSPQPLFIPALYLQGAGAKYSLPNELWERLGTGTYWARFSADHGKTVQCYHWREE